MRKKIFALILSVVTVLSMVVLPAQAKVLEDSEYWSNLSDEAADNLLHPRSNIYKDNFIFVYYRSTCDYSTSMLPLIEYYAKLNDLKICGLDKNEYSFSGWGEFVNYESIGFPLIIVYNKDKDKIYAEHSIRSEKDFLRFMLDAGYDLKTKNKIKLKIGSKKMICDYGNEQMDVPACVIDNRTMIPLRAVSEALGARVEWIEKSKGIRIDRSNIEIWMNVGSRQIDIRNSRDRRVETLDTSPQIVDGRTLVPIRAITEAFGYDVDWDQVTQTVTIEAK